MAGDPRRYDRIWQRRVTPQDRRYRLAIAADMSDSMKGAPMAALARVVVLALEAAARLDVATSLVLFGVGWDRARRVRLIKDPQEPLRAARGRIGQALLSAPALGSETPMAEALDRCRTALGPPEGDDLVVVITDGRPRTTEERFLKDPVMMGSAGDDGSTTGAAREVKGRCYVWKTDRRCAEEVSEALDRLAHPRRRCLGVGLGPEAPVEALFEESRVFEDHRAFARGFPGLLEGALASMAR